MVLISGFADSSTIDAMVSEGVVLLRKPFRIDQLLEEVGRALSARG